MSPKPWICALALLLAAPCAYAAHSGTAPIDPEKADDEHFLVDTGSGLDTGCTFRDGSPLVFSIDVDRFVGDVDGDGHLLNLQTLIANGVIAEKAHLRMPAFDVDSSASVPGVNPEVDKVSFNGQPLSKATLTGENNTWIMNEFEVPISLIKFPARGASGSRPSPAHNEIRIDIDTANSDLVWCTAIDWAELNFKAMAPIVLVHGINAGPSTWDPDVTSILKDRKVPYDSSVQLVPNGGIDNNGAQLAQKVRDIAQSFGVKKIHLVVHSKGGLDSRRFLSTYYTPTDVKVLSLYTLSTPHHGAVLADISIAQMTLANVQSTDPNLTAYLNQQSLASTFGQGPQRPGLDDLQTTSMATFNLANAFPPSVRLYTIGADADVNNDGKISNAEAAGLIPGALNWTIDTGTLLYSILRNVAGITVVRRSNLFGLNVWHEISPVATAFPLDNDLAVTDSSSQYPAQLQHFGPLNRNHSNIKGLTAMEIVLGRIQNDFPLN